MRRSSKKHSLSFGGLPLFLRKRDLQLVRLRCGLDEAAYVKSATTSFAFLAAVSSFVSIAVSHSAHAIVLVLLAISQTRLCWPPIAAPVCAFFGWTIVSALFSGDPLAGWPQLRKAFVYSMLVSVYTLFPTRRDAKRVYQGWFVAALVSSVVAFGQFAHKWQSARQLGQDFLSYYEGQRITGLLSHWMTFSQAILLAFIVLVSYLLFSRSVRGTRAIWLFVAATLGLGLILSLTRGVFLALGVVALYFVWTRNRKLLWFAPIALAVMALAAPDSLQRRVRSIVSADANEARIVMWRTGWNMIQERPWFGIGTGRMSEAFEYYVPDDVGELPPGYYGHLHSIYVHYAAERGVPGLLALLWLLGTVLRDHIRGLRRTPPGAEDLYLLHAGTAGTITVMVVGAFDLTLGDSEVLATYLILIALTYHAVRRSDPEASAVIRP